MCAEKILEDNIKNIPIEKIDFHLEKILRASGSSLKNYSMQTTIANMRKAVADAILSGSVDANEEIKG